MGILEVLQGAALVGTLIGGGFTVHTFRRNSRIRRAEWLYALYTKFYEEPQYKRVRRVIDYETPELARLLTALREGGNEEEVEQLNDYLNFLEFVGSLWRMEQLSIDEIRMVFEYYINRLGDFPALVHCISSSGYESLAALMSDLKKGTTRS